MMASKASKRTTTKTTTPARKTPGTGIMRSIVPGMWLTRYLCGFAGHKLGSDADFCFEELRDGAASFGGLDGGVKFRLIRAGNVGNDVEMALGDGEAFADFFERDGAGGFEFARGKASAAELRRKRHGETARVSGGEQFFGVGADSIFETGAEGILRVLQRAAIGRDAAFTRFQVALPNCGSFALHV